MASRQPGDTSHLARQAASDGPTIREGLFSAFLGDDSFACTCRLTLLLFIVYGPGYWDLEIPLIMLAAIGLASPVLAVHPVFWGALSGVQILATLPRLYVIDNHKVLMAYWCIALCLSARCHETLRTNARYLIGSVFALAALWKAGTSDFLSGSFMHLTMLTDGRFSAFAQAIGHVSEAALETNRAEMEALYSGSSPVAHLHDSPISQAVAITMTWGVLVAETAIALFYLIPARRLVSVRHLALMAFVVLTYPVAPVLGFAWILLIMAYAACSSHQKRMRLALIVLIPLVELFAIPWRTLIPA